LKICALSGTFGEIYLGLHSSNLSTKCTKYTNDDVASTVAKTISTENIKTSLQVPLLKFNLISFYSDAVLNSKTVKALDISSNRYKDVDSGMEF